jgi:hypothetical protein
MTRRNSVDETKTAAGRHTIPLPRFAVETLMARRGQPYLGEQTVIFPSTAGTLREIAVTFPLRPSSNRIALASVYQVFGPSPLPHAWWRAGPFRGKRDLPNGVKALSCHFGHGRSWLPTKRVSSYFDLKNPDCRDRG